VINGLQHVRNESLAKGGTSKERPSPHLHKVPTRSNKVIPQILQTFLVVTQSELHWFENVYVVVVVVVVVSLFLWFSQFCMNLIYSHSKDRQLNNGHLIG
jgi:hypothetical protein